ncbi:MAG: hypothetical protein DWQ07_08185 [Chloroflexi bacterium]|nr:MAG: hypothetical protein DWQ07_08185 [Chloroflexota bacterium]MBL1196983.1 hypothetical protein [Chloroflexota bacterium]NOH14278.1 hypothetical protein [Chloroflexota bacterium]
MKKVPLRHPLWWLLIALYLAACGSTATPEATVTLPPVVEAAPTESEAAPEEAAPTQADVAYAMVNGEAILQSAFDANLARYQAAQAEAGTLLATENVEQVVLDDMVRRLLLAQSARENGFTADDALLDERIANTIASIGGQEAFGAWLVANSFTPDLFRQELAIEIEAAWMRDQIVNSVPQTAEQVLAREVLSFTEFEAQRLLSQLDSGVEFDTIVTNNDPQGLGYLGWFPRGYLLQVELEEAVFALEPGQHSNVIASEIGFHIVQVLEKDPDRQLTQDARLTLQRQALADWLEQRIAQSQFENYTP